MRRSEDDACMCATKEVAPTGQETNLKWCFAEAAGTTHDSWRIPVLVGACSGGHQNGFPLVGCSCSKYNPYGKGWEDKALSELIVANRLTIGCYVSKESRNPPFWDSPSRDTMRHEKPLNHFGSLSTNPKVHPQNPANSPVSRIMLSPPFKPTKLQCP